MILEIIELKDRRVSRARKKFAVFASFEMSLFKANIFNQFVVAISKTLSSKSIVSNEQSKKILFELTSSLSTDFEETKEDIDFENAKKNIDLKLEQSIEKMTRRQKRENQQIRLRELKTQLKFDTLFDESFRDSLLRKYSIFFMRLENEDSLNREKQKTFHVVETQLVKILLENDVCFVVCILVNVDIITLKQFKAHHTIVQEIERAKNDDIFIAMTQSSEENQTMHLSRDDEQLFLEEDNIKDNCFVVFINISLLERLVILEYFIIQLMNQRRIISLEIVESSTHSIKTQ